LWRAEDQQRRLAIETLEELEWCLEQLESMQTHRSVADMAAIKVRSTGHVLRASEKLANAQTC